MSKLGQDLISSLQEALAHAEGHGAKLRSTIIEVPDVRSIREQLHMSQAEFATAYRIPLATLKGWEQGRRRPDQTAVAYLEVISRLPEQARSALQSEA